MGSDSDVHGRFHGWIISAILPRISLEQGEIDGYAAMLSLHTVTKVMAQFV
jgi:hypothetical protein